MNYSECMEKSLVIVIQKINKINRRQRLKQNREKFSVTRQAFLIYNVGSNVECRHHLNLQILPNSTSF